MAPSRCIYHSCYGVPFLRFGVWADVSLPSPSRRSLKRFRYRQRLKLRRLSSSTSVSGRFHRRALPYYLVLRCRCRGGTRPKHRHWDSTYRQFQRELQKTLLLKKYYPDAATLLSTIRAAPAIEYIENIHREHEMRAKIGYNPSSLKLVGVSEDIYTPFFNLHNPLQVYAPTMDSNVMTMSEYLDANPPEISTVPNENRYTRLTTQEWMSKTMATYFRVAEMSKKVTDKKYLYRELPLIWDTGASIGLTPFRYDFIDYVELENVSVKDIARQNKVLGVGTVMWKFVTRDGRDIFLPLICYHVEHAEIRLEL